MSRPAISITVLAVVALAAFAAIAILGSRPGVEIDFRVLLPLMFASALPALVLALLLPRIERRTWHVIVVLGVGVLARMFFLTPDPLLSDDVYRYLWDGRVQVAGQSPYGVPPNMEELWVVELEWPPEAHVRHLVNHPEIPTIYPPLMELLFRAVAMVGGGLVTWRCVLLLAEVGIALLLISALRRRNLDPRLAVLYLWHPLPIVESVWSAHTEVIAVLLLLAGLWCLDTKRGIRAGCALGLGAAAKILPLAWAPFLWRRLGRRRGAVAIAAGIVLGAVTFVPFWGTDIERATEGLTKYARTWYFNDVLFRPLGAVFGIDVEDETLRGTQWLRRGMGAIFALVCLAVAWRGRDAYRAGLVVSVAFVLLTATLHPWYLLWVLPFAIIVRSAPALLLSVTVLAAYVVQVENQRRGFWNEMGITRVLEFSPPLALLLVSSLRSWRARRTPPPASSAS